MKQNPWAGGKFAILSAITLVACSSCTSQDEKTYGQSYDACIIQNASRGGDEDSRSTATEICARHFTRVVSPFEAQESKAKAIITLAPKSAPLVTPAGNELSDADVGLGPPKDTISATISNNDDNLIIKKVHMEANFYNKPRSADGSFDHSGFKGNMYWDFDEDIAPGGSDTVTGNFGDQHPPSPFYSAHAEATMVLPHSNTVRTNALKESP